MNKHIVQKKLDIKFEVMTFDTLLAFLPGQRCWNVDNNCMTGP